MSGVRPASTHHGWPSSLQFNQKSKTRTSQGAQEASCGESGHQVSRRDYYKDTPSFIVTRRCPWWSRTLSKRCPTAVPRPSSPFRKGNSHTSPCTRCCAGVPNFNCNRMRPHTNCCVRRNRNSTGLPLAPPAGCHGRRPPTHTNNNNHTGSDFCPPSITARNRKPRPNKSPSALPADPKTPVAVAVAPIQPLPCLITLDFSKEKMTTTRA